MLNNTNPVVSENELMGNDDAHQFKLEMTKGKINQIDQSLINATNLLDKLNSLSASIEEFGVSISTLKAVDPNNDLGIDIDLPIAPVKDDRQKIVLARISNTIEDVKVAIARLELEKEDGGIDE